MAAACVIREDGAGGNNEVEAETDSVAQIVAQAITELQTVAVQSTQFNHTSIESSLIQSSTTSLGSEPSTPVTSSLDIGTGDDITSDSVYYIQSLPVPDQKTDNPISNENSNALTALAQNEVTFSQTSIDQSEISATIPNTPDTIATENKTQDNPTEIIYFVQDGLRPQDLGDKDMFRSMVDSAVQANDYEIERRSGRVPARRRVIPFKFRDYRNPDDSDVSDSDSDYEPEVKPPKIKKPPETSVTTPTQKRQVGRPRKLPVSVIKVEQLEQGTTDKGTTDTQDGSTTMDNNNETPKTEDVMDTTDEASLGSLPGKRGRGRPRILTDFSYNCPDCGKAFSQKGNLKVHVRIHNDERPFECQEPECGKRFRSNESLRRHNLSHMGIKPFECPVCHNKFSSNVSLQEHLSRHTDARPYQCQYCDRFFRQISCLRRHMITHTTDTPYSCNVCDRKFSQMVYLRSHMKVHTGEKPYSCDICNKRFAHQSDVTRHKIIHTGEKPFQCEVCQTRFSDPSSKRRHLKEHMNRKPYVCTLCSDSFKRAGQLKAHLARKHSQGVKITKTNSALGVVYSYTGDSQIDKALQGIAVEGLEGTGSGEGQQRIVKLIKNLHDKTVVQQVEISLPPRGEAMEQPQEQTIQGGLENSMNIDAVELGPAVRELQKENGGTAAGVDAATPVPGTGGLPVAFHEMEIQEAGEEGQTYIAITDVPEGQEKRETGESVEYSYQIIQELGTDGEQQILLHFNPDDAEVTEVQEVPEELVGKEISELQAEFEKSTESMNNSSQSSMVNYVTNPDFSSQDYYNWLSNFTELCKLVPMPLDMSLFQKISQVQKTLSDVMATPSGVVADKENFKVLMNISKELSTIITEHLDFVLQNLNNQKHDKVVDK